MSTKLKSVDELDREIILESLAELTQREVDILKLTAKGLNSKEIGKALSISYRSVATHRGNISLKLNKRETSINQ